MSHIRIPVHRPWLGIGELQAVEGVFDSRWLGLGPCTKRFEEAIRELLSVEHVIAVSNGTAALHLALHAMGIGARDEVILPSMTFISTAQAILAAGAQPVFCDVLGDSLNIDVEDAGRRVTARTRAILAVHYGGRICDMAGLRKLAGSHGIHLVEDAAHAFGSSCPGGSAGTLGDVGCFSFDPIKNITCGGGGAVVTNNSDRAARARIAANVGIDRDSWSRLDSCKPWFYEVVAPGFRYALGDLHAAIGLAQLERMPEFLQRKLRIVRFYDQAFGAMDGVSLVTPELDGVFPFNYVIRVSGGRRDGLMEFLRERGIGSAVQFIPCHLQPVFAEQAVSLPVTEQVYEEIVTLPLYCEMSEADAQEVIAAVGDFCGAAVA